MRGGLRAFSRLPYRLHPLPRRARTLVAAESLTGLPKAWSSPAVTFGESFSGPRAAPQGLLYAADFVSAHEEADLLGALDGRLAAWERFIRRAQQFFGLVYYQTSQEVQALQPTSSSPADAQFGRPLGDLPEWLLPRVLSTGVFDDAVGINQVQANEYLDDSGIGTHVEDPAAGPAFATLSLLEPIQLTLAPAENRRPTPAKRRDQHNCLKVLLEPRSLLVLSGESRYAYAHAIRQSRLVYLRDGKVLRRGSGYRRVSLTFRGILPEERRTERQDKPEGMVGYRVPQH